MQYRIGDRDPATELYDVIWPDGSFTRNGIKIFNAAHEFGDVVLATQRSDGMMILDGVKATLTDVVTTSLGLGGFGEKPVGYLNGEVFNNEDEVILPIVSIKFAPNSPTNLAPNAGNFAIRISIDRPQLKDLRVKLEFTGTAIAADYATVGLAADSPTVPIVIIPAGANFADITITPASSVVSTKTIIVTAMQLREYRIGQDKSVKATIRARIGAFITTYDAYAAARDAGLLPADIASNNPGIAILDTAENPASYVAILYPKPLVSTSITLRFSDNMLPIEEASTPPFLNNYWKFGNGVDSDRLSIGLFLYLDIYGDRGFNLNNQIELTFTELTEAPFEEWGEYYLLYAALSPLLSFPSRPFVGETISIDLVSVTDSEIANSTVIINVI